MQERHYTSNKVDFILNICFYNLQKQANYLNLI
jgi:hypothetical protein